MPGGGWPPLPARWGTHPSFVGRDREMATLNDAWTLAAGGARQVVFIAGEAGVGKSLLVSETAARLHAQQAAVLLGTCVSSIGAPYQPFVEPLTALIAVTEAGQLPVADSDNAVERRLTCMRIITCAERTTHGHIHDDQSTRQLFEACAQTLLEAAKARPMVLVLEDLHWAGDTALRLLRYLVRQTTESRILLVATLRTPPRERFAQLVSTVSQLYRLDGVHRIDLGGLTTEEIADYLMLEARVTPRSARGPATVLRDQTAGNPFLLREVWRELAARGGLSALNEVDLRVAPESFRDTVSRRLDGLPADDRRTVEIAAVIGEEFSVSLLTEVTHQGKPNSDLAALVDAGLAAGIAVGLIEPAYELDGVYRFPQAMVRHYVLELMTEHQRASDNAAVATVLEEQFPPADLLVQRLAHHYADAQAVGYADKAVRYLAAAAELTAAALAHHEAARLFERAAALANAQNERDSLRLKAARCLLCSSVQPDWSAE